MDLGAHGERVAALFGGLLDELGATWPADDLAFPREEVAHGEYGEALDELLATAKSKGRRFTAAQVARIREIADLMEVETGELAPAENDAGP